MKQRLFTLLFVLFAIAATVQAQVILNTANFPDANFRAALAEKFEISEGGEITAEKIATTTSLYVSNKSIENLTGIEHFITLTWLECANNQLASLDVSKNISLKVLICENNQLTSFDISKNVAIETLNCSNNQLTSLNVSLNKKMKALYCSNNQITILDLSKNTALVYLSCDHNLLYSLDVSKNIELKSLFCGYNQLSELNVQQNTVLGVFNCCHNQLFSLDVTKNTALGQLECYGNQIKGEFMDVLVASMPSTKNGYFVVVDMENECEGNVCSKTQVSIVKEKGWRICSNNNVGWLNYEGSDNALTLGWVTTYKGRQIVLPISLENEHQITGFQFDLYLPDGVTVATNSKEKMLISTTDRMEGTYTISSSQMDGFIRILGYSADGDAFSGNSGDILNVTLNIADNVADGNYTIRVKDIVLSDVNSTEYHPADAGATLTVKSYVLGDVDNSGAININDVVCIINHILNRQVGTFITEAADVDGSGTININDVVTLINRYILHKSSAPVLLAPALAGITDDNYLHLATISLKPGETKEIEMILTNGNAVAAVQGNIKLPEGVSFVTKSNGRLDVKNIDSRSEDFTLSCALQEDGSMTFAHYSADGFTYDGSDGGIFTFKVKADENAVPGNYNVNLSDVVLSINGVGYELTNRTSALTVGNGTTGIRSIDNSPLTTDSWYTIDGKKLAGEPTRKGVYIVNGKKVMK